MYKTKFASYKLYLFSLLRFRKTRNIQTDESIPHLLLCLKKNDPETFKSGSSMYVCMLLVQLALMINLKTVLFITGYPYFETVLTAMLLLSLKPMF